MEFDDSKDLDGSSIGKPRVYISYSWHTKGLDRKAKSLADKLRKEGIDSRIDLYHGQALHGFTPPPPQPKREAWDYWQEQQVKLADRIIVFCTPEYSTAAPDSGVDRDRRYMKADLESGSRDRNKLIPVGMGTYEMNAQYIPDFMQGATYYDLSSPRRGMFGLSDLIRRLKSEYPGKQKPELRTKSVEKQIPKQKRKGGLAMPNSTLKASQLKGTVHVAIMTIRPDEYDAMEAELDNPENVDGNNTYKYSQIALAEGEPVSVVLTRVIGQGNASAQSVATNIINELDPAWLFLVGIAGGVPDPEFSLGDVVLATYLHDFSLMAAREGDTTTYQAAGGNMHRDVERFLATRAVGQDGQRLRELAGFTSDQALMTHPEVFPASIPDAKRYYGSDSHKGNVEYTILRRFPKGQRQGGPIVCQGACANGNILLKDTKLLKEWQRSARQLIQVEMELAGVYQAARTAGREDYPVLAIRGISDIVGFARDSDWTAYACKTAAAYASAVLQSGLIDFSKNLPPNPN